MAELLLSISASVPSFNLLAIFVIIVDCERFAALLCSMLSKLLSLLVSLLLYVLNFSVMFIVILLMGFDVFLLAFSAFKASTIVSTCLLVVDD